MTDLFKAQPLDDPKVKHVQLDENVLAAIPGSSEAIRIDASGHGASFWTRTARVQLDFENGDIAKYFLKVASGDRGLGMMKGEFYSMQAIHGVTPHFAATPLTWGTFKSNPDLHFFLCDFIDMDDELPEVNKFAESLAQLHRESKSPDGKFGFEVTTYNGNLFQDVRWTDTWEECFVNGTMKDFELEREARGPSEEIEALLPALFGKVIPRLLRPLESNGKSVKPALIHGDLWHGNTSNDLNSDHPVVFDAASFYGHNEYDIKNMTIARYQLGRNYMNAYDKHFPVSAPEEDRDDRLALYSLRSLLHDSTLYVSVPARRENLIERMRELVQKFPNGLEGDSDGDAVAGAPGP